DDQLGSIAHRRIEQPPDRRPEEEPERLGRAADNLRRRQDRERSGGKYQEWVCPEPPQPQRDRDKDQEETQARSVYPTHLLMFVPLAAGRLRAALTEFADDCPLPRLSPGLIFPGPQH